MQGIINPLKVANSGSHTSVFGLSTGSINIFFFLVFQNMRDNLRNNIITNKRSSCGGAKNSVNIAKSFELEVLHGKKEQPFFYITFEVFYHYIAACQCGSGRCVYALI